ncbi:hypothetical protein ACOSQ4_009923 [Xanthoceras sorbifolium]
MRHLQNLVSVGLVGIRIGLCAIKFPKSPILDELLHWLANACLPLKKVVFSECYNFSFVGVCFLLSKNRFLEYLNLKVVNVLNDGSMISINLDLYSKLTNSTFFTLKRECPVLSEIRMKSTNLGVEEFTTELVIDPQIKSLHLAWNGNLSDEFMKKVAIITEEGIGEILKSYGAIQCLRIESCRHINSLKIKHFEVKKLVVLQVGASGIDNDALIMIANTCPQLLYLNLSYCIYVTTRGVKEVVEKCRALREILLYFCRNVDTNILSGIVFSRPSLWNIG